MKLANLKCIACVASWLYTYQNRKEREEKRREEKQKKEQDEDRRNF
jgi:hypothetical protein